MSAFPNLLDAWRAADRAAHAAEDAVLTASLQALDRQGTPPTLEDREGARRLRRIADAFLQAALAEMKVQASASGRRDLKPFACAALPAHVPQAEELSLRRATPPEALARPPEV